MLATLLAAALWTAPLAADTTPRWAQVSVGSDHACALDDAGRAWCWGSNHNGQLGAATPQKCGIVGESGHRSCYPVPTDTPVAVGGGMRFASILAGRYRTCALDREGRAFCWGAYVRGTETTCLNGERCSLTPLPYEPEHRFRSLAGGSRVICGITVEAEALCTNLLRGDRWWELEAMRPLRPGARARDVGAFADWPTQNVCMVDESGSAWCRGSNRTAQLGSGAPPTATGEEVDSLARVAGGVDFRRVVIQDGWACALDGEGRVFCWGVRAWPTYYQADGRPPGGCERRACAPAPVAIGGALRFRDIAAHRERICGLTAAGEAYCWAPTRGAAQARAADDYAPVREQPEFRFRALAGNTELGIGNCGITLSGAEIVCWGGVNEHARRVRIAYPRSAR
ncbi:MAG TPA: hypothetical protein VFJ16_29025 [Longimicrobium sp.]|nr:hypothetical protein [Longimicrobium sp.]